VNIAKNYFSGGHIRRPPLESVDDETE
jgi:hypothetical protein